MLTSDLVDNQIHLAIGALAQFPDDLIVLINIQLLQILGCNKLQLLQDVDGGTGSDRGGAHSSTDRRQLSQLISLKVLKNKTQNRRAIQTEVDI